MSATDDISNDFQEDQAMKLDAEAVSVDPEALARGEACVAAREVFRINYIFKIIFWALVAVFATALTILLVVALYLIVKDPRSNVGQIIASGAGAVVSGLATGFLTKKATEASRAESKALRDIKKYCDPETKRALQRELGRSAAELTA
jgi:di/tricarboxylate transporter